MTPQKGANRPGTTLLLVLVGLTLLCCGVQLQRRALPGDKVVPHQLAYRIDLNRADEAQLMLLPGIGPAIAGRIVAHRRDHGAFESLDALRAVTGVGPTTVARLEPYVRL